MTARPLYKTDELARALERVARLQTRLDEQTRLRKEAEANAARFHAMLLQARVALLVHKKRMGAE